jgi:hypothetical protein
MGDITVIDYRRTDQRQHVLENPYWITSGLVSAVDSDDKGAILFSFPKAGSVTLVHDIVVENFEVLDTGVTVNVGIGTLATNAVTTGGVVTEVDRDQYIKGASVVLTANTKWGPTTAQTSTWLTAAVAMAFDAVRVIVGAATAVPAVYSYTEKAGAIATGTFRVHMLISSIPGL